MVLCSESSTASVSQNTRLSLCCFQNAVSSEHEQLLESWACVAGYCRLQLSHLLSAEKGVLYISAVECASAAGEKLRSNYQRCSSGYIYAVSNVDQSDLVKTCVEDRCDRTKLT
ncbi:hypothetical protein WN944_010057 [Citrus x changshan-huyou]|uniref:Uncharacterized protein n=1 Tax=Citrus x changshan-huyou TaxID=2935761 RepID=A0AAP0MTD7_9ROSI